MQTEHRYRNDPAHRSEIESKITELNQFESEAGELFADIKVGRLLAAYRQELARLLTNEFDIFSEPKRLIAGFCLADDVMGQFETINKLRPDVLGGYVPNSKPTNAAQWCYKLATEARHQFNHSLWSIGREYLNIKQKGQQ